jgi:alkanesulfonate monooxygenase SsuD/methylene tetrahydromethanopterin reductase-like flavin-dependent oxidoreductase (luciferase family)
MPDRDQLLQPSDPTLLYSAFSVNDHYPDRPRSIAALYAEVIGYCELAERLGFDSYFVAEHHFHEYGVVPNPAVMLAALAPRTTRIRLGSAISILTFHNPLTVAESYAMVDVLSGGRLVYGVGSGYLKHEFAGYNVALAEKRERFDEVLGLVRRLLRGERVTHAGKHHRLDAVALNVLPVQPEVPCYVAILAREAAYHVGRQGHKMLCVPYASLERFEDIAALIASFRRGRAEAGLAPSLDDAIVTLHCHVADSDAQARADAEAPFDLYVATRLYAHRHTYDDVMRSGLSLIGSVATVADKLRWLHAAGVRHVALLNNFGLLPADAVRRSMTLFATEVMRRVAT